MMSVCADACCLINLIKGEAIEIVSELKSVRLYTQGLVEDEIGESFLVISGLVSNGKFQLFSGDQILASEVGVISDRYNIGLGESECIAIGLKFNCSVASDDKKARKAASAELGKSRTTGSMGLLKIAVGEGLISKWEAHSIYCRMLSGGGFLPALDVDDFV